MRRAVEASIGRGTSEERPSEITLAPQVKRIIDLRSTGAPARPQYTGPSTWLFGIVRLGDESPGGEGAKGLGVDPRGQA